MKIEPGQYKDHVDEALTNLEAGYTNFAVMQVYEALGIRKVLPPDPIILYAPLSAEELNIFIFGQERLFDDFVRRKSYEIPLSHHLVRFWASFGIWREVVEKTSHLHLVVATLLRSVPVLQAEMDDSFSVRIINQWTGRCIQSTPGDDKRTELLKIGECLFGASWSTLVGSTLERVDSIYASIVYEQPPFLPGLARILAVEQLNLPSLGEGYP